MVNKGLQNFISLLAIYEKLSDDIVCRYDLTFFVLEFVVEICKDCTTFEHGTKISKLSVHTEIWAHDFSFFVKSTALRPPEAPPLVKSNIS